MAPKEALMKEASRLSNFNDLKAVNWNVPEIRRQIKEVSQEIRLLKKEIRTSYHQITWNEQCSLGALKHRATVLAALQAFRRGNIHFVNSSISDQFLWLKEHLSLDDRRDLARIEVQAP